MTEKSGKTFELSDRAGGKSTQLPVRNGTVGPAALDIANLHKDLGVFTYDPGFGATAATESRITYIDGDAGVLLYRGYPIEQLALKSSFMEVAYLLLIGELPTAKQLEEFTGNIRYHTMINESLLRFFNGFHHNAHPMAMVSGVVASMSAFYHDTMDIHNPRHREIFAHRIIAKIPTIAAAAHKHSLGPAVHLPAQRPGLLPPTCSHMLFAVPCEPYKLDPVAAKALDLLFILHADHEQNASTSTVRLAGSTGANPYAAISAGVSALWGPAHGGANEAVLVDARADRHRRQHPEVPDDGQGQVQPLPAHGLRPPRLQELRPARQDHPRDVPQGARRSSAAATTRCSNWRCAWRRSRSRTSTSSSASSTRTWISTPASSTARSASRARCSR